MSMEKKFIGEKKIVKRRRSPRLLGISVFAAAIGVYFASCATTTYPAVNYHYPQSGNSNNATIVVKDYQPMGIIFVKSSEIVDGAGNHTGSKITYEMLMLEAKKLDADDVINIRIDMNQV